MVGRQLISISVSSCLSCFLYLIPGGSVHIAASSSPPFHFSPLRCVPFHSVVVPSATCKTAACIKAAIRTMRKNVHRSGCLLSCGQSLNKKTRQTRVHALEIISRQSAHLFHYALSCALFTLCQRILNKDSELKKNKKNKINKTCFCLK